MTYPQPLLPPKELLDALVAGECVLYSGAGLSASAGHPTYERFLDEMLTWALSKKLIDPQKAEAYASGIRHHDFNSAADGIISDLDKYAGMVQTYLENAFQERALSEAHKMLAELPFCAALTTNFDTLIEQTFPAGRDQVYTPKDCEQVAEALHRQQFFILKLYGDLQKSRSVMISPSQFEDAVRENQPFSRFMETLFFSRTIFFVGASLEGIEDYLKGISLRRQTGGKPHFALVAMERDGWQSKAAWLEKRYGITIIPYDAQSEPGHDRMRDFIRRLAEMAAPALAGPLPPFPPPRG